MAVLYANSARTKILLHLRNYGASKRAGMISVFPEYNRLTVENAIRKLLQDQLVEEFRRSPRAKTTPVRYLQISEKGRRALADYEEEKGLSQKADRTVSTIKETSRKELVLPVYAICKSMGVLTDQAEKPPLAKLFFSDMLPEDKANVACKLDENGAFYSMNEIRTEFRIHIGDGPLNQVRCVGVIIKEKRAYFVYNMGNKLIYFNRTLETRTRDMILSVMEKSLFQKFYPIETQKTAASCLLFADSYKCIPKVIFGRKAGELEPESENGKKDKKVQMREVLTEHNIALVNIRKVYGCIYFVPIRNAANVFESAIRMTPAFRDIITQKWINLQDSLRLEKCAFGYKGIVKATGRSVYMWPDYDLCFLAKIRQTREPAYVVIPVAGAEDAIAKVLGPQLIDVQLITGGILETKRYDIYGRDTGSQSQPVDSGAT